MICHSLSLQFPSDKQQLMGSLCQSHWNEVNMKQWDFQMLVIFSGIYSCASHRCVLSVSFVCLLNFIKHLPFCTKPYCTLQTFVPVFLVTLCLSPLCAHLGWMPDPGELMALGWFCCPQLNWQSCAEVVYEMTSSVVGSHYSDLIPCKNFLEWRGWGGTLIWRLWCSSACSTYLREGLGEITVPPLCWGWQFYPWLIKRAPTRHIHWVSKSSRIWRKWLWFSRLLNNLCKAIVAFWYKNGPEECALQMGTILEASLRASADKPLTQVPALVSQTWRFGLAKWQEIAILLHWEVLK